MTRCLSHGDYKAHEHFCKWCAGPNDDGYWRCKDKDCVKQPEAECKNHTKQGQQT